MLIAIVLYLAQQIERQLRALPPFELECQPIKSFNRPLQAARPDIRSVAAAPSNPNCARPNQQTISIDSSYVVEMPRSSLTEATARDAHYPKGQRTATAPYRTLPDTSTHDTRTSESFASAHTPNTVLPTIIITSPSPPSTFSNVFQSPRIPRHFPKKVPSRKSQLLKPVARHQTPADASANGNDIESIASEYTSNPMQVASNSARSNSAQAISHSVDQLQNHSLSTAPVPVREQQLHKAGAYGQAPAITTHGAQVLEPIASNHVSDLLPISSTSTSSDSSTASTHSVHQLKVHRQGNATAPIHEEQLPEAISHSHQAPPDTYANMDHLLETVANEHAPEPVPVTGATEISLTQTYLYLIVAFCFCFCINKSSEAAFKVAEIMSTIVRDPVVILGFAFLGSAALLVIYKTVGHINVIPGERVFVIVVEAVERVWMEKGTHQRVVDLHAIQEKERTERYRQQVACQSTQRLALLLEDDKDGNIPSHKRFVDLSDQQLKSKPLKSRKDFRYA